MIICPLCVLMQLPDGSAGWWWSGPGRGGLVCKCCGRVRIGSGSFVGEHGCELQWWWWLQGNHTANSLYSWTYRKLHSIAKKFVIAIECPSFCLLLQSLCLLCLLGYKIQWCRVYVIITLSLSATVQFTSKEISRLTIQVHLCSEIDLKCSLHLLHKTMVCKKLVYNWWQDWLCRLKYQFLMLTFLY